MRTISLESPSGSEHHFMYRTLHLKHACRSPDGQILVSGSDDGTISLLHVASGRLVSQIQCQQFGQVLAHKNDRDKGQQSHTVAGEETSVFSQWFYFSLGTLRKCSCIVEQVSCILCFHDSVWLCDAILVQQHLDVD